MEVLFGKGFQDFEIWILSDSQQNEKYLKFSIKENAERKNSCWCFEMLNFDKGKNIPFQF